MTPEEKIAQLERQLADAKGRIKAVEASNYEIKRNADLAIAGADALKTETEAALLTSAEQMKVAHSVATGIFALGRLSRAFARRKVTSIRMLRRQEDDHQLLSSFVDAVKTANMENLKSLSEKAEQRVSICKSEAESQKLKACEHALAYGIENFESTFDALVNAKGNI